MDYEQAVGYIHSRTRVKNGPDHLPMRKVLRALGNPQDSLKYIHIAGTNGKGSCAAMCANVLKTAGYKTGLNISPYVIDFTERFSIDGKYISHEALALVTEEVKRRRDRLEAEEGLRLTEFETVTTIAFRWFRLEKCDMVCLEVGMGGRDDCTNIIKDSLVSCIMHISYDHTRYLGNTLAEIASHKAGIIKPGNVTVCYPDQDEDALRVIKKAAEEKNSRFVLPALSDITCRKTGFMESVTEYKGIKIKQPFTGLHQSYNISVVIEAMRRLSGLGYKITDSDIKTGIETAKFPARIEVFSRDPLIIIDGGHNADGITALVRVLSENGLDNLVGVWASLSDKFPQKLVEMVSPYLCKLYTADLHGTRALPRRQLAETAKEFVPDSRPAESVARAVKAATEDVSGGVGKGVLVFGSLYIASDARLYLAQNSGDNL